ncbi:translational GTPase TypA [Erysipelothrix rhusiopathiae]|uniref:translational GTPase TypA n=1 Tax=Erysipelothrix rhusiopathiae TaxID=1648 RepID=UPI00202AE2E8|nr:translational GTPase TypA [Erysipelothrix rhusiopathiae]URQ77266.1 translational GTPase TypA [Erysipelothrix rhusiopathiae]
MKKIINVAIIAHVDAGKSTLVDGILSTSGAFKLEQNAVDRVMDRNDLEKERGITIYSKNCSVFYKDTKINIVDTPGHADFAGEVERIIKTVDTVILLVDSVEGPMPQTRFVLRKALEQNLKPIVLINKMDKSERRPDEVLEEIYDLFLDLDADESQLFFPILYGITRDFKVSRHQDVRDASMDVLFDTILEHTDVYADKDTQPLQMQVSTLDYDAYLGRLGIGRIHQGVLEQGQGILVIDNSGKHSHSRIKKMFVYNGVTHKEVTRAHSGDIVVISGISSITVGDTICSLDAPIPMEAIMVEQPTLSMNFYVNSSPLQGKEGKYITSRNIKERLDRELEVNVGMKVEPGLSSDYFTVSGRGELHLSVLIETMRREGYELSIGKPHVILKERNGIMYEPIDRVIIETPEKYSGKIIEQMSLRHGNLYDVEQSKNNIRQYWYIPARLILGFRTDLINLTRGNAILMREHYKYDVQQGILNTPKRGSLISNASGNSMAFPMFRIQDRGSFFIGAQTEVYPGMIVGVTNKENDMWVNVIRNKRLNSYRGNGRGGKEDALKLEDPITLTLEYALDYITEDDLVEVTPLNIRLRKKNLRQ